MGETSESSPKTGIGLVMEKVKSTARWLHRAGMSTEGMQQNFDELQDHIQHQAEADQQELDRLISTTENTLLNPAEEKIRPVGAIKRYFDAWTQRVHERTFVGIDVALLAANASAAGYTIGRAFPPLDISASISPENAIYGSLFLFGAVKAAQRLDTWRKARSQSKLPKIK